MAYDTPNYAIPGLMPTGTPKEDARIFANADGSLELPVYEDDGLVNPAIIKWAVDLLPGNLILRDSCMTTVVIQSSEGNVRRYTLSFAAADLPYGTSVLDVVTPSGSRRYMITRRKNQVFPEPAAS